ncbi:MAG: hypothetical protein ACP5UQ_04380, partial [Anaerolineae bacterium]
VRQEGETSEALRDEIVRLVLGRPPEAALVGQVAGWPAAPAEGAIEVAEARAEAPVEAKPTRAPRRRRRRSVPVAAAAGEAGAIQAEESEAAEPIAEAAPEERPAGLVEPIAAAAGEPAAAPMAESAVAIAEAGAAPAAGEPTGIGGEAAAGEAVVEVGLTMEAAGELREASSAPELLEAAKPAKRRTRRGRKKATTAPAAAAEGAAETEATMTVAGPAVSDVAVGEAQATGELAGVQAAVTVEGVTAEAGMTEEEAAAESGVTAEAAIAVGPDVAEAEIIAAELPNILEAPAVGVEIIASEERQGVHYFTVRDLRNCNTVHNVTATSARRLWSYAINQYLKRPVDLGKVTWSGDYGLWQASRRARKWRYDLVKRQPDGSVRVFYGVTADGMDGPWAQFLKEEDRAG